MNRCKLAAPTAHVIDGVSGDAQIVELWSAKFENFIIWCILDVNRPSMPGNVTLSYCSFRVLKFTC